MPEPKLVEAVARAISGAPFSSPSSLRKARAALDAIRNHTFGTTVVLANGTEHVATMSGDLPQTVLRALIDLAMAEGPALAVPEEGEKL